MSPEPAVRLVTTSVRASVGQALDEFQAAIGEVDDWRAVLRLASAHGVMPLVASALLEHASNRLPADVAERLRGIARENASLMLSLSVELVRMRGALAAAGIRCLTFKGPALAQQIFGQVARRRSRDLDVLVTAHDLPRAHEVLAGIGYTVADGLSSLDAADLARYFRAGHTVPYELATRRVRLDLQTSLVPAFLEAPAFDALWDRRAPVTLPGGTVDALGDEDVLPYLCFHGLRHAWERFQWVADIGLLMADRHPDTLCARLADWRGHRAAAIGTALAGRLTGITCNLPALSGQRVGGAVDRACATVFGRRRLRSQAWLMLRMQCAGFERWQEVGAHLWMLATKASAADWVERPHLAERPVINTSLRLSRLAREYFWEARARR